MTLRQKTLLLIGVTLISLLGVLYTTLSYLLMSHLYEIEQQRTRQEMRRALNVLSEDVAQMSVSARQWGAWDDTYAFMEDNNKRYIPSNLSPAAFSDLQLNVIVLLRNSGQKVFSQGFDLKQEKAVPVPQELTKQLAKGNPLLRHPNLTSARSGILVLPQNPLLIASQPIVTTDHKGPVRGTLIMGRYLNTQEIKRLETLNQLSLTVKRVDDSQLPPDFQTVRSALETSGQKQISPESSNLLGSEEIVVSPLNDDEIAGYVLLKDIYNKPALILRVDMSRAIHKQGRASLRYLIISLFGVGLVFCIGTLLFLEKLVL